MGQGTSICVRPFSISITKYLRLGTLFTYVKKVDLAQLGGWESKGTALALARPSLATPALGKWYHDSSVHVTGRDDVGAGSRGDQQAGPAPR